MVFRYTQVRYIVIGALQTPYSCIIPPLRRYFGGSREQVKRSLVVLLKPRAEPKHKTQDDLSSSTPVSV